MTPKSEIDWKKKNDVIYVLGQPPKSPYKSMLIIFHFGTHSDDVCEFNEVSQEKEWDILQLLFMITQNFVMSIFLKTNMALKSLNYTKISGEPYREED